MTATPTNSSRMTPPDIAQCAAMGWRIVPLHNPIDDGCSCGRSNCGKSIGKHPRIRKWELNATSDLRQIERWARKWPQANWGVQLGPASGIVDIEGDSPEAVQALRELFDGDPPPCPTYRSARGLHRLFLWRDDLPPQATFSYGGLDFKLGAGTKEDGSPLGSQSVFPPSIHSSGIEYTWITSPEDCPPPPLPDAVQARIWNWRAERNGSNGKAKRRPSVAERCRAYMAKMPDAVEGQHGHDAFFAAACVANRFHADEHAAFDAACWFNENKCKPPESDAQLKHKFEDARKAVAAKGEIGCMAEDDPAPFESAAPAERKPKKPPPLTSPRGRTDRANGLRFYSWFHDDFLYVTPWRNWVTWTGKRWEVDHGLRCEASAQRVADALFVELVAMSNDPAADEKGLMLAGSFVRSSSDEKRLNAMLKVARSMLTAMPETFNQDPMLFNCANGTIDLRTGDLRPHRREDFVNTICPHDYNPDAKAPTWYRFLADVFEDQADVIGYLRRHAGYSLTGSTQEQIVTIYNGDGQNGKSTLLEAVLHAMGSDYATPAVPDLLLSKTGQSHLTEIAMLHGKRLVTCMEVEKERKMAEAMVKQLTGTDTITARRMREDPWQFAPTHKLILCCNDLPTVEGTDHAIWRRIRVVPFNVTFKKPDKKMLDKLKAEAEGILAWMVQGCLEWQRDGLREPEEVLVATKRYREHEDTFGAFLAECCVTGSQQYNAAVSSLIDAFKDFCGEELTHKKLKKAMEAAGFKRRERYTAGPHKGKYGWWGIGLRSTECEQ